jgi:hypothetical protein
MFGLSAKEKQLSEAKKHAQQLTAAINTQNFEEVFRLGIRDLTEYAEFLNDEISNTIILYWTMSLGAVSLPYIGNEDAFFQKYDAKLLSKALARALDRRLHSFMKPVGNGTVTFAGEVYDFFLLYWFSIAAYKDDGETEKFRILRDFTKNAYDVLGADESTRQYKLLMMSKGSPILKLV